MPVRLTHAPLAGLPAGWLHLKPRACPCCTGRVEMQVALARLLRAQRPSGIVIEIANADHLPALRRVLGEWPLSESVELAGAASE